MTLEELRIHALKTDETKYLAKTKDDWEEFKASWNKLGEEISDYAIENDGYKVDVAGLFKQFENERYTALMLELFQLSLKAVAARISEDKGVTVDADMVQLAIISTHNLTYGIQTIPYVIDKGINTLYNELIHYDFPIILGEIILDEIDKIDLEAYSRILDEKIIKVKGQKWTLHKNDADPFPSNPHAHNYESGLKLDLSNGKLYKKKTEVTSVNKKNLMTIRGKFESFGIEMPQLTV